MNNLLIFGFKSSGKSYFGKKLAEKLSLNFIDTDKILEKTFRLPCAKIYLQYGEEFFRKEEEKIILSLKAKNTIIALGGGTVLSEKNQKALYSLGTLVYLNASYKLLKNRFKNGSPVCFNNKSFDVIYRKRTSLYEKIPAKKIDIDHQSEEEILLKLERICYGK